MKNYYKLLDISNNSTLTEIKEAYKKQIAKLQNIETYTEFHKKFIKELKIAKYILIDNKDLKEKYDLKLSKIILENQKNILNNKYKNHLIGQRIFDLNTFKHDNGPMSNVEDLSPKNQNKTENI